MKVFTVKKTSRTGSETREEILHNTVFSSESDAVKALKADFDAELTPNSSPVEYDEKNMEMKKLDVVIKWKVMCHDFNDGKLG